MDAGIGRWKLDCPTSNFTNPISNLQPLTSMPGFGGSINLKIHKGGFCMICGIIGGTVIVFFIVVTIVKDLLDRRDMIDRGP